MNRNSNLVVLTLVFLSSAATVKATPYSNRVLADNPLVYLNFNETSGTVANNLGSLGAAGNGTYNNTTLGQASAPMSDLGTSAGFNGTNANVTINDNAAFDVGTGAFSVEFWFRTNSDTRGDLFTYKGAGGDYGLHSNSESDPVGFNSSVSTFFNSFNGKVGADSNLFHHFVATRAAVGGAYNMYIDGNLAFSGNDTDTWNIAGNILIGSNTGAFFFNGNIDEVAIYSTALSAGQVSAHFAAAFIPEPATFGMSMLALTAMGLRRRRVA